MKTLVVRENSPLLPYLLKTLVDFKRNKIKNLLKFKSILVNGAVTTKHNHPLATGDKISILTDKNAKNRQLLQFGIQIVYEDDDIIVINKPAGLLTVGTEKIRERTAFYQTFEYVKQSDPRKRGRVFIVHRLDREASGLLVLAKNMGAKSFLQNNWQKFEKKYLAIVHGTPKEKSGTISSFLAENKFLSVYSGKKTEESKHAVTKYRVIKSNEKYSLIEITLETGRKHQIRVHLKDLGHPIVGDNRYSEKVEANLKTPAGRLALHAYYLAFNHPVSKKRLEFKSELPESIKKLTSFFY
ncbi:MAG: RluA family pseudouridine synthase [Candidatus Omnitrophica bacterium]|nr:RluA family pseudouridine synthase [Candidatus Omnitrophota bacterium]